MKKVSLTVTVICLICILTGCGKSVPKEELPQSFSNIESTGFSEGIESEGQSEEIQSNVEENSVISTDQKEPEQIQSEQTEGNGLLLEEMSILMKIGDEIVTVRWEDNESVAALAELLREQPLYIQMSIVTSRILCFHP
ncbi:MAG: hypothetical protein K2G55_16445 [Lachnospiraceae bacterium]|nr:hypothetical protein [Lachnospiraceae bacterium]MDE7201290.1 hypothetical protein [Lachnospiraceae bacterium]